MELLGFVVHLCFYPLVDPITISLNFVISREYCFNRNMRIIILSLTLLFCSVHITHAYEDQTPEDDDFAEFEQFEVDDEVTDGGNVPNIFLTHTHTGFYKLLIYV
ncbi:jg7890, partial [Pararge aegeria aegeria]